MGFPLAPRGHSRQTNTTPPMSTASKTRSARRISAGRHVSSTHNGNPSSKFRTTRDPRESGQPAVTDGGIAATEESLRACAVARTLGIEGQGAADGSTSPQTSQSAKHARARANLPIRRLSLFPTPTAVIAGELQPAEKGMGSARFDKALSPASRSAMSDTSAGAGDGRSGASAWQPLPRGTVAS